jgi:hypothetical protein
VHGLEGDGAQDKEIERALKDVSLVAHAAVSCRFTWGEYVGRIKKVHSGEDAAAVSGSSACRRRVK